MNKKLVELGDSILE